MHTYEKSNMEGSAENASATGRAAPGGEKNGNQKDQDDTSEYSEGYESVH